MDQSELMLRGARALLSDLCKQIEDVLVAVPELGVTMRSWARKALETNGPKAAGPLNGTTTSKLASDLQAARAIRFQDHAHLPTTAKAPYKTRKPMSEAQKLAMSKRMKKRWKLAKQMGVAGSHIPKNTAIGRSLAKGTTARATATDNGSAAPSA
jgi:hypothetical protein